MILLGRLCLCLCLCLLALALLPGAPLQARMLAPLPVATALSAPLERGTPAAGCHEALPVPDVDSGRTPARHGGDAADDCCSGGAVARLQRALRLSGRDACAAGDGEPARVAHAPVVLVGFRATGHWWTRRWATEATTDRLTHQAASHRAPRARIPACPCRTSAWIPLESP